MIKLSRRAKDLITSHFVNLLCTIGIFAVDYLVQGKLIEEMGNNYIGIVIALYSVFIAMFLVASPFIMSIMVRITDKRLWPHFNIMVDSTRIALKEGVIFFLLGLFTFSFYSSSLPGPWWGQYAVEVIFIFTIVSICHTVYDGVHMLNTLVKGMIDLSKDLNIDRS